MSLFAIADTHLSLNTNKSMDCFPGWEDYVRRLRERWNAVVSPDDFVVIAGDISWAMSLEQAEADFRYLHELNGKKLILKGNHDFWWNTRKKIENFLFENGFSSIHIVHNSAFQAGPIAVCGSRGWLLDGVEEADQKILNREVQRVKTSIDAARKLEGEPVVFLHYPPVSQSEVCEELLALLKAENIKRCFYGHLHGNGARYTVKQVIDDIQFSLISADYLGFCPILIEKF